MLYIDKANTLTSFYVKVLCNVLIYLYFEGDIKNEKNVMKFSTNLK